MGLVLNRVLRGEWVMVSIVAIGVIGGLAALGLWWQWDRRIFRTGIQQAADAVSGALVCGGYLVEAGFRNVHGERPRRAEVVFAASPSGLKLFDPRHPAEPTLSVRWADVIDVLAGDGLLFGEQRKALVVLTLEGRLVLVLRGDERRGILSAGDAAAEAFVAEVRQLRGGSPARYREQGR